MTKKLVNENLKGHQKKINEIIKPQLTILPMNDLAKSLKKFIQEEVHDILINIKMTSVKFKLIYKKLKLIF